MKIGPVDIRNHVFQKRMRGVDEGEVMAYLDLVADRLEEVILEGEDLRDQMARLEQQLEEFRRLERTLRDSLVSAERVADDRLAHAEQEAHLLIKNAEVDADRVARNVREEVARLRGDIDDLRRQRLTYVERFRALLRSQQKILEASVETFDPEAATPRARPAASPTGPPRPERVSEQTPAPRLDAYLGESGLFAAPPLPPGSDRPAPAREEP
jgi:cell division initiation protein